MRKFFLSVVSYCAIILEIRNVRNTEMNDMNPQFFPSYEQYSFNKTKEDDLPVAAKAPRSHIMNSLSVSFHACFQFIFIAVPAGTGGMLCMTPISSDNSNHDGVAQDCT